MSSTATIICSSTGTLAMSIYCLSLGVSYPTPGGCTSLDNGDLPNQTGLDMGWWFEVYGAIGLTAAILTFCAGFFFTLSTGEYRGRSDGNRKATTQISFSQISFSQISFTFPFYLFSS